MRAYCLLENIFKAMLFCNRHYPDAVAGLTPIMHQPLQLRKLVEVSIKCTKGSQVDKAVSPDDKLLWQTQSEDKLHLPAAVPHYAPTAARQHWHSDQA